MGNNLWLVFLTCPKCFDELIECFTFFFFALLNNQCINSCHCLFFIGQLKRWIRSFDGNDTENQRKPWINWHHLLNTFLHDDTAQPIDIMTKSFSLPSTIKSTWYWDVLSLWIHSMATNIYIICFVCPRGWHWKLHISCVFVCVWIVCAEDYEFKIMQYKSPINDVLWSIKQIIYKIINTNQKRMIGRFIVHYAFM